MSSKGWSLDLREVAMVSFGGGRVRVAIQELDLEAEAETADQAHAALRSILDEAMQDLGFRRRLGAWIQQRGTPTDAADYQAALRDAFDDGVA